jgi:4-hydroxyproline epimerase
MQTLTVIDSHTEGEPTRVVIDGVPDLGSGPMRERLEILRDQHDWVRSACANEPRGFDAVVGAVLLTPVDPANDAGVIFFNNTGYLHMCGHGTMGVAETLRHLGRLRGNVCRLETPVGTVTATFREDGAITVENVPSYRRDKALQVEVEGLGLVTGDVAWGGNWFFLTGDVGVEVAPANIAALTEIASRIRASLTPEIDHVEIFGPPTRTDAHSKNFVLCPGGAYDRSPCGTGTSAKLACLFADGKLREGETWRQESVIGSLFEGRVRLDGDVLVPSVTGRAYVTCEAKLLLQGGDPFRHGIPLT